MGKGHFLLLARNSKIFQISYLIEEVFAISAYKLYNAATTEQFFTSFTAERFEPNWNFFRKIFRILTHFSKKIISMCFDFVCYKLHMKLQILAALHSLLLHALLAKNSSIDMLNTSSTTIKLRDESS